MTGTLTLSDLLTYAVSMVTQLIAIMQSFFNFMTSNSALLWVMVASVVLLGLKLIRGLFN